MGVGETLVAGVTGDLLRRVRAPHLMTADASARFAPCDLGCRV
jgi:hypothetical protein